MEHKNDPLFHASLILDSHIAADDLTVPMVPWHRHVWTFLVLSYY